METPLSLAAGQRGREIPCPCRTSLRFETLQGAGLPGQKNFCLTPQAATKFFCPPLSASSEPDTEMKCQGSPKATRSGLTLTRDEPRTLLLEEGKGCKAFLLPSGERQNGVQGALLPAGVWGKAPHQRSSTSVASGKIPFRVIRSRHTVRADFRVSRKRNS